MNEKLAFHITPVTTFAQNSSLLWCTETKKAAIIDPGGDVEKILKAVDHHNVVVEKILLTHGHIDHVGFAMELAKQHKLPIIGPHADDKFLLQTLDEYGQMLGLQHSGNIEPDQWLRDGDEVSVGKQILKVIHCPGHTPGHVVFYHKPSKLAVVGDVLFQNGIGRTDFPRGNHADLLASISQKLLPLGDDVEFIPGHGENSTFGQERCNNPYLQT